MPGIAPGKPKPPPGGIMGPGAPTFVVNPKLKNAISITPSKYVLLIRLSHEFR
jgi:hypothetical protein